MVIPVVMILWKMRCKVGGNSAMTPRTVQPWTCTPSNLLIYHFFSRFYSFLLQTNCRLHTHLFPKIFRLVQKKTVAEDRGLGARRLITFSWTSRGIGGIMYQLASFAGEW